MQTDFPTPQQTKSILHHLTVFINSLPKIGLIILSAVLLAYLVKCLIILILRLFDMRHLLGKKMIFLELTPPAFSDIAPHANQQFFADLHGFETIRSIVDRVLLRKIAFSAEIVGNREQGIRYIFCVPKENRESFIKDIAAFGSDTRVEEVPDYLSPAQRLRACLLEFKLKNMYHPLQSHPSYVQSDPVGYLLGAMAYLNPGEVMALQLVLSPIMPRKVEKLRRQMLKNEVQVDTLGHGHGRSFGSMLANGVGSFAFGMADMMGEVVHGPLSYNPELERKKLQYSQQVTGTKPARLMGSFEHAVASEAIEKLCQPLFRTNVRALIVAGNARGLANDIRKSFNVYRTSYQAVISRMNVPIALQQKYRSFLFVHRLPCLFDRNSCLLSNADVASIYHFPRSDTNRIGDVITMPSKALSPSPIIKKRADNHAFDVMLGRNVSSGHTVDVGLTAKEREKHMIVIGGTGNGKTTLLMYAILQDIQAGKGVAVLDPHGDLAKTLLCYIPEDRIKDVVYLNPRDIKRPIGLNLLELPAGLDEDELLHEKGRVATAVVSVMRKVFSDDEANAHRIEAVMRNAIHTAFTVEDATLFTVLKLLRNSTFRKGVVSKLDDEDLKDFWQGEMGQAGEMQMVSMTKGVTQRIDRFNTSEPVKRMLSQPKSTIDFEDIMNSGKILICNLAHGELEEDESALFGTTVLAKLKMAAERRITMPENERRPFYVYVDEFQNFATTPFVKMLSSSRKYKLFLTIAEQSTMQQEDDRLTEAILANVSTVVCFRTGSHADEELMLHRFDPYLTKGEISNLPAYNFYIRIQAQESIEPMSGVTVVLPEGEANDFIAAKVVKESRETYGVEYVKPVKAEGSSRIPGDTTDGNGKKGSRKAKGGAKKPHYNGAADEDGK